MSDWAQLPPSEFNMPPGTSVRDIPSERPQPMSQEQTIEITRTIEITPSELLRSLTDGERKLLLQELCGGAHLPIAEIRAIVNDPGYDD